MPGRSALLLALGACGRLGFDPVADGDGDASAGDGDGGIPITLELPMGGNIDSIAIAPDGTWYAAYVEAGVWRSDDQHTWTRCGGGRASEVAVASDGTVYGAAGSRGVLVSTDRCATWTVEPINRTVVGIGTSGANGWAVADNGLRTRAGTTWSVVPTPADGTTLFADFASRTGRIVVGTAGGGVVVSPTGAGPFTQVTTGLATRDVSDIAIGQTGALVMTLATSTSNGGISCSDAALTTWSVCFGGGGNALAVDPIDDNHIVFAPYDNLGQTTNRFGAFALDLQRYDMDGSNVNDLAFTPASGIVAATWSGVYFAADKNLQWEARVDGFSAWDIANIVRHGEDLFVNTQAGVMRSIGGVAPFTRSTAGMFYSTRSEAMAFAPDGTLLVPGREIWLSADLGATWTMSDGLGPADGYYGGAIAMVGSRAFVGTYGHVLVADPPWTTWTPHDLAGTTRRVYALLATGGRLWAGTADGLFVSSDEAATFTAIAAITTSVEDLIALPDGGIAVATGDGVWTSDPATTTWTLNGPPDSVFKLALLPGTGLIAATEHGGYVSRDRGVTWTQVAGSETYKARAAIYDAATDSVVLGTLGQGLVRFAMPR